MAIEIEALADRHVANSTGELAKVPDRHFDDSAFNDSLVGRGAIHYTRKSNQDTCRARRRLHGVENRERPGNSIKPAQSGSPLSHAAPRA